MMTSLYSEPIPVTEITSDWCKFHFPRDSRVITCVNLTLVLASWCGCGPHEVEREGRGGASACIIGSCVIWLFINSAFIMSMSTCLGH